MIGASVFNILTLTILCLVFLVIFVLLLRGWAESEVVQIVISLAFLGSLVLSFMIYQWALNLFSKKVDMDKYFLPWVIPKKK